MAENYNTYGDISPRTGAKAVKRLLTRGQYMMHLERFGQVDPQQKNKTKTVKWRRYLSLERASAPLAEGVPPKGQKLRYEDVTATLEQYGDWVPITDVVADTHEDAVLSEASDLCGEQAAETIEELRFNVLKAGTNVFYASGVTSRATVNAAPSRADFRKIKRAFMKNKARPISKIIKASPKISTQPVAPSFFALAHTDLEPDLRGMSGFVSVENYSDSDKAMMGEIGKCESVRFILSAMYDPWLAAGASGTTFLSNGVEVSTAAQCDVYPLLVLAKDAYGIVPLQGLNSIDLGVVNPGKKTASDPLGQQGFVSWKTMQTAAILNQSWIARLECAAIANPT
jgi:N4-gp56 family major capsid protein